MPQLIPYAKLTGRRFGALKVIEYVPTKGWRCLCDCGRKCIRTTRRLTKDTKQPSCGCKRFVLKYGKRTMAKQAKK